MLGKVVQQQQAPEPAKVSRRLTDFILNNWAEVREARPITTKDDGPTWEQFWFSASSLHKLCPRMCSLGAMAACRGDKAIIEVLKPDTLWNFDVGHAYHDVIQGHILPSLPDNVFQGSWQRYEAYGSEISGPRIQTRTGLNCGSGNIERGWEKMPEYEGYPAPRWNYLEPKFRNYKYRLVGKADGILVWEDRTEALEIKTEKAQAMQGLDPMLGGKPRPAHVLQVQSYLWQFDLKYGRIFYVEKGAPYVKSAFVEHVIERDDKVIDGIKALLKECWGAIEHVEIQHSLRAVESSDDWAIDNVEVPKRLPECTKKSDYRAKYCDAKQACFAKPKKKK